MDTRAYKATCFWMTVFTRPPLEFCLETGPASNRNRSRFHRAQGARGREVCYNERNIVCNGSIHPILHPPHPSSLHLPLAHLLATYKTVPDCLYSVIFDTEAWDDTFSMTCWALHPITFSLGLKSGQQKSLGYCSKPVAARIAQTVGLLCS